MTRLVTVLVLVLATLLAVKAQNSDMASSMDDCGPCDRDRCLVPDLCVAGIAKDRCGCCDVCAKREFELCEHPQVWSKDGKYNGKCGDHLKCKLRTDLENGDENEAVCYCSKDESLCGSDEVTYTNICQLAAAAVMKGEKITVKNKGHCKTAPVIVSKPDNAKDIEGSNVALVCEATGYPIPTVEWTWTRVDGKTVYLPSDDLHVSVNMRGGPEKWQITGWLQVMEMKMEHEGDYTCIAQNELGVAEATARLIVVEDPNAVKKDNRKNRS